MEDHERLRQEYQLVVLQHQYDIIELALHHIRANRMRRRRRQRRVCVCVGGGGGCLGQTMNREATTIWPVRPASGGTPKRGPSIFQELHVDGPRDVRWNASQSGAPRSPSSKPGTGSHWSLAWTLTWFCDTLPLGASMHRWSSVGRSLTTPSHFSSGKSCQATIDEIWARWSLAPPLLMDGVSLLTSYMESGTSPINMWGTLWKSLVLFHLW